MLRDKEGKPLREDTRRREKTGRQENLTRGIGDYRRRRKFKIEDLKKMKEKERRYKKKLRKIS